MRFDTGKGFHDAEEYFQQDGEMWGQKYEGGREGMLTFLREFWVINCAYLSVYEPCEVTSLRRLSRGPSVLMFLLFCQFDAS